ncbi:hypothetical protein TNCV_3227561 [Trichonephila clavipes]|nr:hypothetical protein TNCV_3227561 [Trichonephila clavipes]
MSIHKLQSLEDVIIQQYKTRPHAARRVLTYIYPVDFQLLSNGHQISSLFKKIRSRIAARPGCHRCLGSRTGMKLVETMPRCMAAITKARGAPTRYYVGIPNSVALQCN